MTHSGSCDGIIDCEGERILALMGNRGGWHVDDLCDASGLSAAAVCAALVMCEIAGQVGVDPNGRYSSIGGR